MHQNENGEYVLSRREYTQFAAAVPASHATGDDGWLSGLFGGSDNDGPGLFEDTEYRHEDSHIITDPKVIDFVGAAVDIERPNEYDEAVRIRISGDLVVEGEDINPSSVGKDTPADSVATEDLNNVYHASSFSGSNGRAKAQNALDRAGGESGLNAVVLGPLGSDDLSGVSNTDYDNGWLLDQALQVPSDTALILQNAYVFLQGSTADNLIRNQNADSGDATRDSNIHILGVGDSWLHGNAANQTTTSPAYRQHGIQMYKVDNWSIRNLKIGPVLRFAIEPEDVFDYQISGIEFNQTVDTTGSDPIHVTGPAEGGVISNLTGKTKEDVCSVNSAGEGSFDHVQGSGGDVRDITFTNVSVEAVAETASLIRTIPGNGNTIEDVTWRDLKMRGSPGQVMELGWDGVTTAPTIEEHRDLTIDGVTADATKNYFNFMADLSSSTFSHLRGSFDASTTDDTFFFPSSYTLEDVTVTDFDVQQEGASNAIRLRTTVDNLTFRDGVIEAPTATDRTGLQIGGAGSDVDGLTLDNVTFEGQATGVHIESNATMADIAEDIRFESVGTHYDLNVRGFRTPNARAYLNATGGQSITGGAWAQVALDAESHDNDRHVDLTNNRLLISQDGKYVLSGKARFQVAADQDSLLVQIQVNGTAVESAKVSASGTGEVTVPVSTVREFSGSSNYRVTLHVQNQNNGDTIDAGEDLTYLEAYEAAT